MSAVDYLTSMPGLDQGTDYFLSEKHISSDRLVELQKLIRSIYRPELLQLEKEQPVLVKIDLEPVNSVFDILELGLPLSLDRVRLVSDIVDCLVCEDSVDLEIEYYCHKHAECVDSHQFASVVDVVHKAVKACGKELFDMIRGLGLYRKGILNYRVWEINHDRICLLRQDLYFQQVVSRTPSSGI